MQNVSFQAAQMSAFGVKACRHWPCAIDSERLWKGTVVSIGFWSSWAFRWRVQIAMVQHAAADN